MPTPVPTDEADRLAALHRYAALDIEPTTPLTDVARLAAQVCGTPIGAVTLVDTGRVWVAAGHGTTVRELPRESGVCGYTIVDRDVTVVPDALRDSRFAATPLVVGPPHLRFYAGAALIDADGYALGAVCAMDVRPREICGEQAEALRGLARQVIAHLELRRTRAELTGVTAQLSRAARLGDDFVALISHEVRTPMTSIQGYVNLLLDDLAATHPQHDRLAAGIEDNCRRLRRLIEQLLFVSQAEQGAFALQPAPTDLAAVAEQVATAAHDRARRTGVDLILRPGRGMRVLADEARLVEALDQVVGNAVAYTPAGGTVEVGVYGPEAGPAIVVRDTGVGIPEDEQRLVLDRFYRGRHATRTAAPGAGLGLSIARTIVEAHGGRLELSSAPGAGTTVGLRLPPTARWR